MRKCRKLGAFALGLTRFVDDLRIPLDNNASERQARGPALGRKNYYGSGALWSGRLAAAMFSLLATLSLAKLNIRKWLRWYLQSCVANGGIYLTHDGIEHGLVINAGLQDQSVGYSARLPLMPSPQAPAAGTPPAVADFSFAELGLMSGAADPMMNFPSGTVFTPYSLVRNISRQSATVTPTLWWMQAGGLRTPRL